MIDKQILLVSTLKNVLRTVWRICILTLGCKGLNKIILMTALGVELSIFTAVSFK